MNGKYILTLVTLGLAVVNAGEREFYDFGGKKSVGSEVAISSSVVPSVIVATGVSATVLTPVKDAVVQGDFLDIGLTRDAAGGSSGTGDKEEVKSALEGTFYDLKQIGKGGNRRVSKLARRESGGRLMINKSGYHQVIARFVQKGWSRSLLNRYYKTSEKLYASHFYQPVASSRYAPIALRLGDPDVPESRWTCQPGGWCAVFSGRVRAPKTGKFRFIGTADDYIGVRFNKQVVLSAGYRLFTDYDLKANEPGKKFYFSSTSAREAFMQDVRRGSDRLHKGYEIISTVNFTQYSRFGNDYTRDSVSYEIWKRELGGLVAGKEFAVKEGEVYNIEIIVADEGNRYGFVLFIEDTTEGKNSTAKKYDLFRTDLSTPSADEINQMLEELDCAGTVLMYMPYNENSPVWTVVPSE